MDAFPRAWQKALLVLCNLLPLLHLAAVASAALLPLAWPWRLGLALAVLYALPPILGRALLAASPLPAGEVPVGGRAFFTWWALLNLQMLFTRLPALEEVLRLVPGAYETWLRAWGARVGHFILWTAGLRLTDRSLLDIGSGVVFGTGVRIVGHLYLRSPSGTMTLALGPVVIGAGAQVGGYSILSAGTEIAAGEVTRACLLSPPFSRWEGGRRTGKAARA